MPAGRFFAGFTDLPLRELELNRWRRPEPQTRGETCLRSCNDFDFNIAPRHRNTRGESWN